MKQGYLSQYFSGYAVRTLTAVEAEQHRSNQHEFSGVAELRSLLGDADRREIPARFVYLSDDDDAVLEPGFVSWYDARRARRPREEWRLYYSSKEVSERAGEGDLLILALRPDGSVLTVIAQGHSTVALQLLWLFGEGQERLPGFSLAGESEADRIRLQFASGIILREIGIEPDGEGQVDLDALLHRFGASFPNTRTFSDYARSTLDAPDIDADPDGALLAFLEREEQLFRAYEAHLISGRLRDGFAKVDDFLSFSLSVQNRRKSRAGSAFENHLEHVFSALGLQHDRTPVTEGKARPDFLFPGISAYRNPDFPAADLTVLAAKSSCKDRWRQVLPEADRVPEKHLITLEPAISPAQTSEMQLRRVHLVVPAAIHPTFLPAQQSHLLTLADFAGLVRDRQSVSGLFRSAQESLF